jgi:CheY-like chemotaxis protein
LNPKSYRSRRRVLLIEDHELIAEAIADFIRSKGLDVRIASTGLEALETAAAFYPEIVLCDMRLPDMPGTDVARALRAAPGTKEAVIAMHTAMNERDLGALARHVGPAVNMFLPKPITEEQLDTLISLLKSQAKKHF